MYRAIIRYMTNKPKRQLRVGDTVNLNVCGTITAITPACVTVTVEGYDEASEHHISDPSKLTLVKAIEDCLPYTVERIDRVCDFVSAGMRYLVRRDGAFYAGFVDGAEACRVANNKNTAALKSYNVKPGYYWEMRSFNEVAKVPNPFNRK